MKLLQKIPSGINLHQAPYEWRLAAQDIEGRGWGSMIFQGVFLVLVVIIEAFILYRLGEIWNHPYRYQIWFYVAFYPFQAWVGFMVVREIVYNMQEGFAARQKVLEVVMKNEDFELIVRNKKDPKTKQKKYNRTAIKEIFYNQGPQKKAALVKKGLSTIPQELFIRPKGAAPEAWGRFLTKKQTTFLALLLRELYAKKKVDKYISVAPPPPEEDDFEDLSQHLIDD